ncbi:MAG: DoxX family protein, partial [Actinomycetota bacterium]
MFIATVIVSSLLALAALGSGIGKLTKQPALIESLTGLGVPQSWIPLLGVAELAGAVGLVVGF